LIQEYDIARRPGTRGVYRVNSTVAFRSRDGVCIEALPGWFTDGASVPMVLRWWAPPFAGPYTAAAIIHDILYRAQPDGYSRAWVDHVLYQAMCASSVRRLQAIIIYAGVRLGGWAAWRSNRKSVVLYRNYLRITGPGR
jgi:hypothetical protein